MTSKFQGPGVRKGATNTKELNKTMEQKLGREVPRGPERRLSPFVLFPLPVGFEYCREDQSQLPRSLLVTLSSHELLPPSSTLKSYAQSDWLNRLLVPTLPTLSKLWPKSLSVG